MSRYFITSIVYFTLLIVSLAIDGAIDVPLWWYLTITSFYLFATIIGSFIISLQFYMPIRLNGEGNLVALTFDDGPFEEKTEQILETLKAANAPACFFCIGHRITKRPDLVARMDKEGHLVGNHTYWHGALFDLKSSSMMTKELADTDEAIYRIIRKRPKFFRPPYGVTNPMVAKAVNRRNYTVIGWSLRSFDTTAKDPQKLLNRIKKNVSGGDIILFHDYSDTMLAILPAVLEHLEKVGLKVVRVDQLLKEKPYAQSTY
jgi:peptidoglycan-N-acetylglucosamine deacetylase